MCLHAHCVHMSIRNQKHPYEMVAVMFPLTKFWFRIRAQLHRAGIFQIPTNNIALFSLPPSDNPPSLLSPCLSRSISCSRHMHKHILPASPCPVIVRAEVLGSPQRFAGLLSIRAGMCTYACERAKNQQCALHTSRTYRQTEYIQTHTRSFIHSFIHPRPPRPQ